MRVLVTGGAGFIGVNLVRMLLDHSHQVTILDNLSVGKREHLDGLSLNFIKGDILDTDLVNQVVPNHDGVIHLAAQTGVPGSLANPRRDCEINILGTLNVLEACCSASGSKIEKPLHGSSASGSQALSFSTRMRFILASSNAALGRQTPPATEDKAPLPISPYGASKLAGEAYCMAYHGSWGLGTVALRFGNVYGPFSAHKGSVVAKFFKDVLEKGQVTIDGDGRQTRDLIYVDDLCRAVLLALESQVGGEVFQIATGVETSILELATLVREAVGKNMEVEHGPARQGDIRKNFSGIHKAGQILGWHPYTPLSEGLRTTWRWYSKR